MRSLTDSKTMKLKVEKDRDAMELGLIILGQKGEASSSMKTRIQVTFQEMTTSMEAEMQSV